VVQTLLKKMHEVTQIDDKHSEYLQLLKYEVGEFYKTHHDYIPMQKGRVHGVRILTCFLYLNDVEEGILVGFVNA
jgi:prolyl 4-hydroxylase